MKKKIMLFAFAFAAAIGLALTSFAQPGGGQDPGGPECNYTNCPSGYWNCCTEGGVTLYKN